MPDIAAITGQQATQTNQAEKKDKSTLGQDDFLTLLVAQLQNQDPLNPSDATEFTAQLAQYSQLEQLFNLNTAMDQMTLAQNNSQRISALGLIGKEVLVSGKTFTLGEEPVDIGYQVHDTATAATLRIQDQFGKTVDTVELTDLDKGNHSITWTGVGSDGTQLDPGKYTISIQATGLDDETSAAVTPLVRSEVTGVRMEDGVPKLVTDTGDYTIDAIHGAYDKSTSTTDSTPEDGEQGGTGESTSENEAISAATDGAGIIEDMAGSQEENG